MVYPATQGTFALKSLPIAKFFSGPDLLIGIGLNIIRTCLVMIDVFRKCKSDVNHMHNRVAASALPRAVNGTLDCFKIPYSGHF